MLEKTLVVLGREFGRTLRINDNDGQELRDEAFACLLAGAGIDVGRRMGTPTATTSRGRHGVAVIPVQTMSALLSDLQAKGLPNQTLVVLGTEFVHTHRNNDNDERDHRD